MKFMTWDYALLKCFARGRVEPEAELDKVHCH